MFERDLVEHPASVELREDLGRGGGEVRDVDAVRLGRQHEERVLPEEVDDLAALVHALRRAQQDAGRVQRDGTAAAARHVGIDAFLEAEVPVGPGEDVEHRVLDGVGEQRVHRRRVDAPADQQGLEGRALGAHDAPGPVERVERQGAALEERLEDEAVAQDLGLEEPESVGAEVQDRAPSGAPDPEEAPVAGREHGLQHVAEPQFFEISLQCHGASLNPWTRHHTPVRRLLSTAPPGPL